MLCPTCEKHETSIVSEKYDKKTNSVKRNRYCICGNSFDTYEKIKKSEKRNPKQTSLWKNCRFCFYASQRIYDCVTPVTDQYENFLNDISNLAEKTDAELDAFVSTIIKKEREKGTEIFKQFKENFKKLKEDKRYLAENIRSLFKKIKPMREFISIGITKKGGKNYYDLSPEMRKFFQLLPIRQINKIKFVNKKETINKIVKQSYYWEARYDYLKKPIEDMKNKNLVRKESQEYYKSVCDYIKDPQYNKDFFIQHLPQTKDTWDKLWNVYLKIR